MEESNQSLTGIVYLNGRFMPLAEACISPLDRGFTFGDGVYEVMSVWQGQVFQVDDHIQRLNYGLQALGISEFLTQKRWHALLHELVQRNGGGNQTLYCQITRGPQATRDIRCPDNPTPTVFIFSNPQAKIDKPQVAQGLKAVAVTDIRWKRCDIKTTSRLAYVLMHQEATQAGCDEAIIIHNGVVLEGTTSNVFIIRHGVIMTPLKNQQILHGVTRDTILKLAEQHGLPYRQTKLSERDLTKADELWITSATRGVCPVVELNQTPVGPGTAGPLWYKMFDLYWEHRQHDVTNRQSA